MASMDGVNIIVNYRDQITLTNIVYTTFLFISYQLSKARHLSMLICARCISRLRDAHSFRVLVVATERHLLDMIEKHMVYVDGKLIIVVTVKIKNW